MISFLLSSVNSIFTLGGLASCDDLNACLSHPDNDKKVYESGTIPQQQSYVSNFAFVTTPSSIARHPPAGLPAPLLHKDHHRAEHKQHNLHEIKRDAQIPLRERLRIEQLRVGEVRKAGWFSVPQACIATAVTAPGFGPQHENGGGDPEEEDDDFGEEAEGGAGGGAAGEGVRGPVVGYYRVDSQDESEDGGDDCEGGGVSLGKRRFFVWGTGYHTSNGERAVDVGPPAAVSAAPADEDEEPDAEEELGDAGDVEGFRVGEKHADGYE